MYVGPLFLMLRLKNVCEVTVIYTCKRHILKEYCEAGICISLKKKSKNISPIEILVLIKPSSKLTLSFIFILVHRDLFILSST